ncbi:hypothetical protein Pla175_01740 [Pirellulimonas nuda]|uniref:Uncharacterized protein n=1 Tax=Pirellulimonas nuda TaxID=2528009 RepID=A0A518D5S3_9BACT|nr:hypothetical protein [Pirellulimonas nuda]QDU86821.1 hypothetical protein Pla175_01740 [Pirellulimonas nuda]
MASIQGHFDGVAIVLDEPAKLAVGQRVRVVVESPTEASACGDRLGAWKGKFRIIDSGDEVVLDHFQDYLP